MPMDYDDNDFNIHTVHLAGEESSTVSSVLRPYALPKFDYDNSRQGNLRFDSLVENEVFLGITGQEDNQWIEEYSHASSGVEFSSSVAEPRRNNVWSEATSSESVEMLLKSVGREEGVLGDTISEKFDASDEPNSLAAIMDPNLKQDDGSDHVIFAPETMVTNKTRDKFSGSNESNDCEKSHVTSTTQSDEAKISDGELNSVVLGEKCNLYEEKVDRICDVNQEVENVAVELDKYEPQDLSTSKVECVDMGSKQNVDASKGSDFTKNSSSDEAEYSIKNIETSLGNPNTAVETSKYSDEKTSVVSNVESLDNPLFEVSIPVNEESTSLMTKGSCSLLMTEEGKAHVSSAELSHGSKCAGPASPVASEVQELDDSMHGDSLAYSPVTGLVKLQHIEDDNTKSGILASPESNASSPSKVSDLQSRSVEETENTNGSDARHATPDAFEVSAGNEPSVMPQGSSFSDVGANLTNACSSPDLLAGSILNKDLAASINTPKAHSQDMEDKEATELSGSVQVNDGIGSSEQQGLFIDQDVNSNERGDARLSLDHGDIDIEVVGALDSQKSVELTSSAEGCEKSFVMTHGSEADMTILAEPVPDVKSSSLDPFDGVHLDSGSVATNYVAAELPIRGVSPVHHDNEQKREAGFLSTGSSENESPKVASRVDCASEEPLSVVEKDASPDHVGKIVHGVAGQSVPPVENINDTMSEQAHEATSDSLGCSATLMTSPPGDPSAKVGANVEAGGVQDPKESMSGHYKAAPLSLEVDISTEQHASIDVVLPSECDASHSRHDDDCSVSMDKLRSVYPSDTNNTEPSDSAKVTHEMVKDNALLPQVLEDSLQLVSSNRDTERDKSLKSEVSASTDLGQTVPAIQACNLLTNMEGSSTIPSSSVSDPKKSDEVTLIIPQTPSTATIQVGAKGNAERKTRRKSVGKVSAKKVKETTPRQSGRVEKSSMLLTPQATGHVIQFDEMKPKEVASSITKPTGIRPLPDLNNATSIFQQPFTDNQQVQLRAQILVYGSLISGTSPEEPHMVAAFGQSDGGRKTWEAAWYACLERVRNNKSQVNNPGTPLQSQADLKDAGTKQSPLPSKVLSSPIGGASNKATPPVVSPLIPLSTPLWNVSTPSSGMPRSALLDYRQSFSPLHPYQTPPVQNLSGHNPPWLSQGPFAGHWLASSPVSTFNAGTCFSALPITEAVKLTPVKLSGSPGIKHTYSIPVVHSAGPSVFSGASPLSDAKNATVSSSQASSDSKGRKRKKAASRVADQTPVPSQALIASVTAPPVAHLPQVPRTDGHNHIPLLVGNPTNLVIAPVVSSIFSTSVTVSAPASKTTRSSPGRFLSISNETLNKAEECKGQAEDVGVAANTSQPSSDSKSIHRKKVTTSLAVDQTSTPRQAPVASITAPVVAYLPHGHSHISLLAQNQTDSATAPVACSSFPTSVGMSRPVSITSKSNPGSFHQIMYSAPRSGYQNTENAVATEEALSKVEQSKLQAENAALLAAAEVSHCQDVWSGLELQRSSGVVSDGEAKLMSSAVSIAAAAAVAKMAAAAAKIASDVAEQARLMADEVLLSSKTENINQSSIMSHPNVIDRYDKATPASIMKGVSKSNHPNSIISVAREAARRRIEAASAASKHAENLDAIVKAAELAAEAVSQAGKIVAMGDSSALRELVEAGPEGYWKTSPLAYEVSGQLNSISGKKNSESAPNVSFKEIQTLDRGLVMQQHSVHLAENQVMVDSPNTGIEKETRIPRAHSGPKLSKAVGVSLEIDAGALHTHIAGQNMPQSVLGAWEQHNIKEGCLVEVYKDDGKYKGAWLAANVLSLKDEKALVCYTEIQSPDEGSEKLKEWVSLEVEGTKVPSIRIAHPMTTMRFEGAKKRRRTAVTDHAWSNGDRVDVWMQDCWRMGVVMEPNKIDVTSLSVQFPGEGETSVVRSWNVRPTLVWKDGKWIEWSSSKGVRASESETPKEKRMKLGNPAAKDKSKEKSTNFIDVVEVRRHEETGTLPLSAKESSFNVGKSSRDDNKLNLRTMKSGLQRKEGTRVIFGVPKPGKKQKFMDVSKHYVADGSNKNNDPGKFARHLKPQAHAWKVNSREIQVAENTSRLKSRKPPVPSFRTLGQKDNNLILGDSEMTDRDRDAVTVNEVENLSSLNLNQIEFGGSSSNSEDATTAYAPKKAFGFTPKSNSKHLNEEAQDKSFSETTEPRRSNRRIQPTSRLLEGLQSSLTISKIPSFSHTSHRSHKVTSKDNVKHG